MTTNFLSALITTCSKTFLTNILIYRNILSILKQHNQEYLDFISISRLHLLLPIRCPHTSQFLSNCWQWLKNTCSLWLQDLLLSMIKKMEERKVWIWSSLKQQKLYRTYKCIEAWWLINRWKTPSFHASSFAFLHL